MQNSPLEKIGYAKKQAKKPDFSFLTEEDNRRCIKLYDEENVPQKRTREESEEPKKIVQTVIPQTQALNGSSEIDKIHDILTKLSSIFQIADANPGLQEALKPKSPEAVINDNVEPMPHIEDSKELLNRFVQELDKATKLTPNQIKVVEAFGVPYEIDPWKYAPRITGKHDQRHEKKQKEFKRNKNFQRNAKKFEDVNLDEILAEIPENLRPQFYPIKWTMKKIDVEFSLRQAVIIQRDANN